MIKNEIGKTPTRRRFLQILVALPFVAALMRRMKPTRHDDIVEVDGWILNRKDVA